MGPGGAGTTDRATVASDLAAISEADERSEERLTEIIKQQLGIGEK